MSIESKIQAAEKKAAEAAEALKKLKKQAEAQAQLKLAAELKKGRVDDTRRKILLGSLLQRQMASDKAIEASVMRELNGYLVRPDERALFGLGEKPAAAPAPAPKPPRGQFGE